MRKTIVIPDKLTDDVKSGRLTWWFAPHGLFFPDDSLAIESTSGDTLFVPSNIVYTEHEVGTPAPSNITSLMVFTERTSGSVLDVIHLLAKTPEKLWKYIGCVGGKPPSFYQWWCSVEIINRYNIDLEAVFRSVYAMTFAENMPAHIDVVEWGTPCFNM